MESLMEQMLAKYKVVTLEDKKNAIKEIVQEAVLCGLSRAGFFTDAAFYGGTALRIFYGLDRFSEDLDFSLITPNATFDLKKYFATLENEIHALGLNFSIQEKIKTKESDIKSAFLKGNTKEHILIFYENTKDISQINDEEKLVIKFEIDTFPPDGATFETKFRLLPYPYQVKLYDLPSLFAGKIHACLCRRWQTRIKGRDFYDYLFFLGMETKVNLKHLKARLVESKFIDADFDLTIDALKNFLNQRFNEIDFKIAKEDVFPFIKDKTKLDLWCPEFFIEVTKKLEGC